MLLRNGLAAAFAISILGLTSTALAHVSVAGPAFAGKSQVLTFSVGHGCEGADTFRVEVKIPEQVTSVRALPSLWGEAEISKNDAGIVTSVAWTKDDVRAEDDQYYQFGIRIGVPETPFTILYFPTTQTCRTADGVESTVEWAALPDESEAAPEGEETSPSPSLWVVPPRMAGWNKYTVDAKLDDLSVFDDAQIVWAGDAAYSANAQTKELIRSEDDVDELSEIKAGAEIWVKY
jgi:periplasmic copper chaperone A